MKIKENVSYVDQFLRAQKRSKTTKEITVKNRGEDITIEITPLSSMEKLSLGMVRKGSTAQEYSFFVMEIISKHVTWIAELDDPEVEKLGASDKVEIADIFFDTLAASEAFAEILDHSPDLDVDGEDVDAILASAEAIKN